MKKSKKKLLTPAQQGKRRAMARLLKGQRENYKARKQQRKKTGLRFFKSGTSKGPVGTRLKKRSILK
jgi:hypothetical protein